VGSHSIRSKARGTKVSGPTPPVPMRFNGIERERSPFTVLKNVDRGRIPHLIRLKHLRMSASVFAFFRGSAAIMAADLAVQPHTGLFTQICGDAHVLNMGAYAGHDGTLVFDINDFDETIEAPFEWDLKRLAVSVLLAGRSVNISRSVCDEAVMCFIKRYGKLMRMFGRMPILELARYQIHRPQQSRMVKAILKAAERSTPVRSLHRLTEEFRDQRRFRSAPPLLVRSTREERDLLLQTFELYKGTLQPERLHFLNQYKVVDTALKVVGTGSVGLNTYCVYLESTSRRANTDPLFIQIKEERPSVYARYLGHGAHFVNEGQRVVNGQRVMQLTSDPFLGYTVMEGRDYLVRQLNDHKASLNLRTLTPLELLTYAEVCGELFARGHARGGDASSLYECIGASAQWGRDLLTFAHSYAETVERDWKLFCSHMELEETGLRVR
jgi:uncharacterized protein (DUF2252 family)